jgi:hypothetical protein
MLQPPRQVMVLKCGVKEIHLIGALLWLLVSGCLLFSTPGKSGMLFGLFYSRYSVIFPNGNSILFSQSTGKNSQMEGNKKILNYKFLNL